MERLRDIICPVNLTGGSFNKLKHHDLQDELFNLIGGNVSLEEKIKNLELLLEKERKDKEELEDIIDQIGNEQQKKKIKTPEEERVKRVRSKKKLDIYTKLNFNKFFKTEDGKFYHPDIKQRLESDIDHSMYKYDENETAFERNKRINPKYFREYQENFIENWAVSEQKLVILYYGVGSGKTMIALNCAEQYQEIVEKSRVYIVVPASLVLSSILEFFRRGVDPTRKNEEGLYIYNFISYQQLLLTDIDFSSNSLLIIDEAHNLRNFYTVQAPPFEDEKQGGFFKKKTNNPEVFSLMGNKVAEILMNNAYKFLRTIMMTGTLFVNSETDIEALISIGYNKPPLLRLNESELDKIYKDEAAFKNYYQGLISFYRISKDNPSIPTKKYSIVLVPTNERNSRVPSTKEDSFYTKTRSDGMMDKVKWIINLLQKKPNDKTLIYIQFIKGVKLLKEVLDEGNYKYGIITGKLSQKNKLDLVSQYNNNKINILIFTLSIKEGISFSETNNMIITQPYWNYSILEQVIARGIRLTSHKQGSKSTINIYLLAAVSTNKEFNEGQRISYFDKLLNDIFNNDIKTYTANDRNPDFKGSTIDTVEPSLDFYLYGKMIDKMISINKFEKRLLALPKFEEVNNVENNDFIKIFNDEKIKLENEGKASIKNLRKLKKQLYQEFYKDSIKNITKNFKTFNNYSVVSKQKLVDFDKVAEITNNNFPDKRDQLYKMIRREEPLENLFKVFNIDKQTIQDMNAFFTPEGPSKKLIENSGILQDDRENLYILEPTAGVGNLIKELINSKDIENYLIDCNEFYNPFYQIGSSFFDTVDNIKWTNIDFFNYQSKYGYDYILGNPPFNISVKVPQKVEVLDENKKVVDVKFEIKTVIKYDIDFIAHAYNLLNDDGILSCIISNKFTFIQEPVFKMFRMYLDKMEEIDKESVYFEESTEFKKDKTITKEQTTSVKMVNIVLKKLKNVLIDLKTFRFKTTNEEQQEKISNLNKERRKDLVNDKKVKKKSDKQI